VRRTLDRGGMAVRQSTASYIEERQKVGVEPVLVCLRQAMRGALVHLQRRIRDDPGREQGRGANWHDLIGIAVNNQRRNVNSLQIRLLPR